METRNVKCVFCNADDYEIKFPEGKAQVHRIVKCNNCGLMYANPQTISSMSGKVSLLNGKEVDVTVDSDEYKKFTPEANAYLQKQYIQCKDYKKILEFINSKERGTLLDIGSYAGLFLNDAKLNGWNVLGIEPLAVPRLYSQNIFGLNIISTPFEEANIKNNSVDVIVSCHVIEHIYNPINFVNKAYNLLNTNGIMVLETPTYDSFSFKVLRHHERSLRCDGHIYFFTKKSLRSLVEKCGFHVIKHETVGRTLSLERLMTNIGIMISNRKLLNNIANRMQLNKFILHVNIHDMQRIYCTKN